MIIGWVGVCVVRLLNDRLVIATMDFWLLSYGLVIEDCPDIEGSLVFTQVAVTLHDFILGSVKLSDT